MPNFIPKNADKALILLHGYGSDGDNMLSLGQELHLKNTALFCPNAPISLPWGGYAWFPLEDFDMAHLTPEYAAHLTEQAHTLIPSLQDVITDIQRSLHISPKQIWLGGFSQGGLLALLTALLTPDIPKAIGMSAVPIFTQQLTIQNRPKIILTHGADDFVVPLLAFEFGVSQLTSLSLDVSRFISQNCEHGVNIEILTYLKTALSG